MREGAVMDAAERAASGARASGGEAAPARLAERPLRLLADAVGTPAKVAGKLRRLALILDGYRRGGQLDERLRRLQRRGLIDRIPTRIQLIVGSIDMLRFWITPAAEEYYRQKGIHFGFHQLLRFLDEPASLADPVGFFSERDGIIGHLMQVVHANPVYDLQLLQMFDDGLDQLERQLEQMLDRTHPRAASIGAIVEEADYHGRLLRFVREWRRDPSIPPMLRSNVASNASLADVERTFGTLPAAMRYFSTLPRGVAGAARHLLARRMFSGAG